MIVDDQPELLPDIEQQILQQQEQEPAEQVKIKDEKQQNNMLQAALKIFQNPDPE